MNGHIIWGVRFLDLLTGPCWPSWPIGGGGLLIRGRHYTATEIYTQIQLCVYPLVPISNIFAIVSAPIEMLLVLLYAIYFVYLWTYGYEWSIYIYIFVCITLFFCWATALCVSSDSTKWYSRSMDSCRRTLALQDVNLFPVRRKKPFDMSECQKKCQTEWIYIYIYIYT